MLLVVLQDIGRRYFPRGGKKDCSISHALLLFLILLTVLRDACFLAGRWLIRTGI